MLWSWASLAALALALGTSAAGQSFERNVNRPGGDYRDFDLERPSPALCQAACDEDGSCRAWSYVRPGVQGDQARCWLKAVVTEPIGDSCCVSGVKVAARPVATGRASSPETFEDGVDRPGRDFQDFDLDAADPAACRRACAQQERCAAWTYGAPGMGGELAHCWLKDAVPEPVVSEGYTSGVMPGAMERGIDRPGGTFRDLDLDAPDPAQCQAACAADSQCRAWTYVRPGGHGERPRCFLKNGVPPPFENPDCVSGIKVSP